MYRINFSDEKDIANELLIRNMITVLNSPEFAFMLREDERKLLVEAVKKDLLNNAKRVITLNDEYEKEEEKYR